MAKKQVAKMATAKKSVASKKPTAPKSRIASSRKREGRYIDGFVLPMPKKSLPLYKKVASQAGKIWMDHGALEYRECYGDDLNVPGVLSFLKMTNAKPNESVAFAWIVYKSKAHRDKVNAKVIADPRMTKMMMPFQGKNKPWDYTKMAYGGFNILVNLTK